ncbi:MAG: T9SS type A sorting domain-containing protein [Melioribacter sp.]|nr:T9SS type A sorting domain-containing protein [Melioribacter sp.]
MIIMNNKVFYLLAVFVFTTMQLSFAQDITPPATPLGFQSISYELHINLVWQPNTESDLAGYKIYKWDGSTYQFLANVKKYRSFFSEWIGGTSITNKYKIAAYDLSNNISLLSAEVTTLTHQMTDDEFLDMTQRATLRYFWDWGDPNSGIARERWQPNESDVTNTIGGGGFGVMAIIVGIHRGFISRADGVERMKKIVDFLAAKIDKFHGAFPHWFNGSTGKVVKFGNYQDGGDIVETSFMIQGLLAAKQYFNLQNSDEELIRNTIKQIWEGIDWDFYRGGSNGLYWNWSPTYQFNIPEGGSFLFHGWSETMITYFLAVASPTHPILKNYYSSGWGNDGSINNNTGQTKYGYQLQVGTNYGGPLFWTHYSYLGFDPRGKRDRYANYFVNNFNQTMINRAYCIENPKGYAGYNGNCWGLTASNSIPSAGGYMAHEPGNDNGTIAPTAAISSMPYFIYENENLALNAIKHFYRTYGGSLWGDFGFKDAFNLTYSSAILSNGQIIGYNKGIWFNDDYLAIDQGPIICMIENYRSQLLWNLFMADPDVKRILSNNDIFFPSTDPSDVIDKKKIPTEFKLEGNFPNPFNPTTIIRYQLSSISNVQLKVYDILGKEIATLVNEEQLPGEHNITFDSGKIPNANQLTSGIYFYRIQAGEYSATGKMVLLK